MTKRFRRARIFISHGPLDGNRIGVDGAKRGRWDSTLTKRTTSGRNVCPPKGSFDSRFTISRDWQTTISATNGSLRATSARAWAWVNRCRRTRVPAAPILTAPRCLSASASLVGRKVLWPPTLTPLRKTTSATRFCQTNPLESLHSTSAAERPVPGGQIGGVIDRIWAESRPSGEEASHCVVQSTAPPSSARVQNFLGMPHGLRFIPCCAASSEPDLP